MTDRPAFQGQARNPAAEHPEMVTTWISHDTVRKMARLCGRLDEASVNLLKGLLDKKRVRLLMRFPSQAALMRQLLPLLKDERQMLKEGLDLVSDLEGWFNSLHPSTRDQILDKQDELEFALVKRALKNWDPELYSPTRFRTRDYESNRIAVNWVPPYISRLKDRIEGAHARSQKKKAGGRPVKTPGLHSVALSLIRVYEMFDNKPWSYNPALRPSQKRFANKGVEFVALGLRDLYTGISVAQIRTATRGKQRRRNDLQKPPQK